MKYTMPFAFLILSGCLVSERDTGIADRFSQIQDTGARAIIKASIEQAGGIDRWEAIKRLSYTKDFKLLLESGVTEMDCHQVHDYFWDPLKIDIKSTENGSLVRTVFEAGKYLRTKDGQMVDAAQETLEKAVNTATYVVSMPFKLLDPGAEIKYLGEDTLSGGQVVDVIQVAYHPGEHENHSTSDVWKYYFDKTDSKIVANWVKSVDHYSFIENLSYERVGGILFNKRRQSFRVDSLGNKLYLRAEYLYDNFQLE